LAYRLTISDKSSLKMKYRFFFQFFALCSILFLMAFMPVRKKSDAVRKLTAAKLATAKQGNPYYIIISKHNYELKVYDDEGWYATYPIVFGSKDLSDKMREGDRRTPTGKFKIILKKIHPQWGPELLLDYPNVESYKRFNDRKAKGLIPRNAKIGNGIAIHATRPQEEWTVDNYYNWTDGCISVKYSEMKDLYSYIPVGTEVTIQP
jgi:murein L,D-transpeptidase YafK